MRATLETLEMTPEELKSSTDAVHKLAYFKWLNTGSPDCRELEFWLDAEREWIQHNYVPHRMLDGVRPRPDGLSSTVSAGESRREAKTKPSRHKHTRVMVQ
jgi:hypothetical protein